MMWNDAYESEKYNVDARKIMNSKKARKTKLLQNEEKCRRVVDFNQMNGFVLWTIELWNKWPMDRIRKEYTIRKTI